MVSLQPITMSYVEEDESCYPPPCSEPVYKSYNKGSVMDVLMTYSPLFAYLAQYSKLDNLLNYKEFNGTCFAPCKEYSQKYWDLFYNKIDHLRAKEIVLSSLIKAPMNVSQLKKEQVLPTLGNAIDNLEFTTDCYNDLYVRTYGSNVVVKVVKTDIHCNNGIIHLLNGIVDNFII